MLWVAPMLVIAACGNDPAENPRADPPGRAPPIDPATLAAARAEVEPEPPASAWPSNVGTLADSIRTFESLDRCRARMREAMPVEGAELLADVAYDAFIDDVCGGLAALRDRSVDGCDALSTSAARRGCRRRLALVAGTPEVCPEDPTLPGREPICLAWALRDAGLCRAVLAIDQARCRAVIEGAPACARERAGDRARCEAEARRYGGTVAEEERRRSAAATIEPMLRVELRLETAAGAAPRTAVVDRPPLDRGIHLAARGCGWRAQIGDDAIGTTIGMALDGRARLSLTVDIAAGSERGAQVPLGATGARVDLAMPPAQRATSDSGATGTVMLRAFTPEHGATFTLAIDGTLDVVDGRIRLTGEATTFIRDVDPLPASCAAP